jgi:hypothetical protein
MNNKDNKLIWESYITRAEGIEDDFAEFADENSNTLWDDSKPIDEIPQELQPYFEPSQEGSFQVAVATDGFHDQAEQVSGDGMGDTSTYKLDGYLIGLVDGIFAKFIKVIEPTRSSSLKLRRPPRENF